MLTQCPNCQTAFRITSDILRVANGQVRCGRCHTQFDALDRLIEEEGSEEPSQTQARQQIEVEEPDAHEDITLEGRHIEITGTYRVLDDADQPQVRQEVTEEWVEIDDVDSESVAVSEEGIEVEEDLEERDADAAAASYARRSHVSQPETKARGERRVIASRTWNEAAPVQETAEDLALITPRERTQISIAWPILAIPLVLLLLVQIVHHYRSELARNPSVGPTILSIYSALGLPLTPDWQLHAYEIKQWGVLSDPTHPGTLRVRATITNRAAFPQPYPLLKLVLEDRWGDQVRAREFEPAEYLDPGTATDRMLRPNEPANATIDIVDPGPDAEGFRFDVCMRGNSLMPVCASDILQ
ncbi:MAG: DUF3426 domain-containing protein [Povalibacter sp.]